MAKKKKEEEIEIPEKEKRALRILEELYEMEDSEPIKLSSLKKRGAYNLEPKHNLRSWLLGEKDS